ncbi:serine/threonine protein kinase [Klenkia soli]|uniref:non-specific serine/threonine protein kinase n=1 Tax=Klenkia soli TaxID=1052260 RepID=A0A1H0HE02_9ACTN|nr:serine/threonine-protein kinase [Klenkia soli]SDO17436.1 serine/threonine protein kinase [Klenkia soli]
MHEGDRFGPYRVLGVLGQGGMGEVVRALDAEHEREVALKVLHPQWAGDESYRERFRREARVVARLREPHVVPIHRYGEIDGRLFLDMRLVEGEDLASLLRRTGALHPARAVDLVGQVARALDAAHADGLVHRDVKPSNVLLVARPDGGDLAGSSAGDDFVYLVDFGIARPVGDETGPSLTGTGLTIGSTEYMAPERFHGRALSAATDVYSLACVLYEALTGQRPFPPGDAVSQMYSHVNAVPPPPSSVRPGGVGGVDLSVLDGVVLRGLAKDPGQRWTSAGGMAAAARAALGVSGIEVPRPAEHPPGPNGTAPTTVGVVGGDPGRAGTAVRPQSIPTSVQPAPSQQRGPGQLPGPSPRSAVPPPPGPPPWVGDQPGGRSGRRRGSLALVVVLAVLAVGLGTWAAVATVRLAGARDAAVDAQQALLADGLPADVVPADCTRTGAEGDVLTGLDCGVSPSSEGPSEQTYQLLGSPDAAAAAFAGGVQQAGLSQLEGGEVYACSSSDGDQGWVRLADFDDQPVGRLSCGLDTDGAPVLTWTWDDRSGYSSVTGRGGQDGLTDLLGWWRDNADRDDL